MKKDGTIYHQLGYSYNIKKRYNDGIKVLKLAIQFENSDNSHIELGHAYHNLGQYDVALAQFMMVMKGDPENELSRYYAGLSYAKKGDQKNLQKMIGELTALNSTDWAAELKELVK